MSKSVKKEIELKGKSFLKKTDPPLLLLDKVKKLKNKITFLIIKKKLNRE